MQCPQCGTMLSPGMKECPTCGLPIPPNAFNPSPLPPGANMLNRPISGQGGMPSQMETVPPSPRPSILQGPPMMQRPPSPLPPVPVSPRSSALFPPPVQPIPRGQMPPVVPAMNMAPAAQPPVPPSPPPIFTPQQTGSPFAAAPSPVPLPPEQLPQRRNDDSSRFRLLYIGLIIIFLLTTGGLGYYIYHTQFSAPSQVKTKAIAASKAQAKIDATNTATVQQNASATAGTIASATASVNAKATAGAVSTATALQNIYNQATTGTPAINDSLATNTTNNWAVFSATGDTCAFSGVMHLTSTRHALTLCPELARSFTDFAFQVQLSFNLGDTAGPIFRTQVGSSVSFYAFLISPDGTYAISLLQFDPNSGDLTSSTVLASGASQAIKLGMNQANLVSVVAKGGDMWFYVNKTFVAHTTNTSLGSGLVGVASGSSKNAYSDVSFSNAQLWVLP